MENEEGNEAIASDDHPARDFTISGAPRIYNIGNHVYHPSYDDGMDILKEFVSFGSLHDSSAQDPSRICNPGTREHILKMIFGWVDNIHARQRIFWLHGPAGVGKSAIAQTIANQCGGEKLAASFFFFRSDSNRNDGNRLFPTLAWQLAFSIPVLKDHISRYLEDVPDLPRKAVEIQFERLIAQPFLDAAAEIGPHMQAGARIVIIDGLDECKDSTLQRRLLEVLCKASADGSRMPLRFLICSRPETQIRNVFKQYQLGILEVDLADVDDAHRDIKRYLTYEFARIASNQDIDSTTWPGRNVIEDLVSRSSGQFMYASTIIKFVGDEYMSAISQLDIILGLQQSNGESPFADLDALYMHVLQRQSDRVFLMEVLGLLVFAKSASQDVSAAVQSNVAFLLGIEDQQLREQLLGMHSLLIFEPLLDVYHRSFLLFLQEPSRSGRFHVSIQTGRISFFKLVVKALCREASRHEDQPAYKGTEHSIPDLGNIITGHLTETPMPIQDLEDILRPIAPPSLARGSCEKCLVYETVDKLLSHLKSPNEKRDPNTNFSLNYGRLGWGLVALVAYGLALLD